MCWAPCRGDRHPSSLPRTNPDPTPHIPPQLRGANKAAAAGGTLVFPALLPRAGGAGGNDNGPVAPAAAQPQQPAVDPVGPPNVKPKPPVTCVGADCDHELPPGTAQGQQDDDGAFPHIPLPVSSTTTTTVTMDDGSTLTITCVDDACEACATDAQGRDLGCQAIVCDDEGDCAVAGVDGPIEVEPAVEEPERVPEPRAPKKADGPAQAPAAPKPKPVTEQKEDPTATAAAAPVGGGN